MTHNFVKPHIFNCSISVLAVSPGTKYELIEKHIKNYQKICFTKTWGTVMTFYTWLKKKLQEECPCDSYQSGRLFREKLRDFSTNILIKVVDGKVDLKGAPQNPWLKELYPDNPCFYISLPDFLGMNGAWQWFYNGIKFPGLSCKLHPFYGTYFPTRYEHLEIFDEWLNNSNIKIKNAIDVGTGCGVLVFYMLKHNINNVFATDINPNAIYSLKKDMEKQNITHKVKLKQGSFFAGLNKTFDLVVFNPPWIPGKPKTLIDKGIFYENDFFDMFFEESVNYLNKGSRVVILFSDLAVVENICPAHVIREQIESNSRFKVLDTIKTVRGKGNKNIDNAKLRSDFKNKPETVELWDIELMG